MKFWKHIFLTKRLFMVLFGIVILFIMSFFYEWLINPVKFILLITFVLLFIDILLLFASKQGITGSRSAGDKLSNGDDNQIKIDLNNLYHFPVELTILDEIPAQFQLFDFQFEEKIDAKKKKRIEYILRPHERGIYIFGDTNIYVRTFLGLAERKIILKTTQRIKVYPSFLKLKNYDIHSLKHKVNDMGLKKTRRLGQSMEFEQIKKYALGDDFRNINWKSTAKSNQLMVNQYIDEKSQQVYTVIDKGRMMKMPFNEMTLLDYSINSCLIVSNLILQNHDRVGMLAISRNIDNYIKAEKRNTQMAKILENLYAIETGYEEPDYGKLYHFMKVKITQRGLVILYTNFETMNDLKRQLPYLKGISKQHLLIVVIFHNKEMEESLQNNQVTDVYEKSMVERFLFEKKLIQKELHKNGIGTIYTNPDSLTIDTFNKYLELKAKNAI